MLHRLPYSAVNFWAYEQFTQQWQQCFPSAANHSQDAVLRRLVAGGAAGMCACTLVSILSKSACFCGWIMYDPMQAMLQMMLNLQINAFYVHRSSLACQTAQTQPRFSLRWSKKIQFYSSSASCLEHQHCSSLACGLPKQTHHAAKSSLMLCRLTP